MKRDYYEILQVSRAASREDIKGAYRKIAFECHPDRNPGDKESEDRFKEAADAYDVLSDPQKRQLYDAHGHAGLSGAGFHHYADAEEIFSHFGDIFEDFFGFTGGVSGGRARSRRTHGIDLSYALNIDFSEMVFGTEHEMAFRKHMPCDDCGGTGDASGLRQTCSQCQGHGQIRVNQGFFSVRSTCPQCHGEGNSVTDPCAACNGHGLVDNEKQLKVKVPAGVDDGTRLVLRGEGEVGSGRGQPGDLYVMLHVRPDELYWREGQDLHGELELSMAQAILGGEVEVETLDGPQKVEISRGVQTGEEIKLRRLGIPHVRSGKRGDLILHVYVTTPQKLSRKQMKLVAEFAQELPGQEPQLRRRRHG